MSTNPEEGKEDAEVLLASPQCGFWIAHGMRMKEFFGPG